MAITYVDYTPNLGQTDFLFNFEYLEDEHIKVFIDEVEQTLNTNFYIRLSPTKAVILNNPTTPLNSYKRVRIRRVSEPNVNLVDFVNGSVLTESELDRGYQHNRFLAEEAADSADFSVEPQSYTLLGANASLIATPTIVSISGMTTQTPSSLSYSKIQIVGRQVFVTGYLGFASGSYPQVQDPATTLGSGIQISLPTVDNVVLETNGATSLGTAVVTSSSAITSGTNFENWYKPEMAFTRSWSGTPNSIKIEFPQSVFADRYIADVSLSFNYLLSDSVILP